MLRIVEWNALDACDPQSWSDLVARCPDATVFQRHEWITAWWESFCNTAWKLRVLAAFEESRLVGLLPLYETADGGRASIHFVGEGHSDYQVLIVDPAAPQVARALLQALIDSLPPRAVVRLNQVPQFTELELQLRDLSYREPLRCLIGEATPCPRLRLARNEEQLGRIVRKKSLVRKAARLRSLGTVAATHETAVRVLHDHLDEFFSQHIRRWAGTSYPSLFLSEDNRRFYRLLVDRMGPAGGIVFSALRVDARPIAFHFGLRSGGDLLWYKPAYDPECAQYSPGQVLLGELIEFARAAGFEALDFTRGDEAFKARFSSEWRYNVDYCVYSHAADAASMHAWRTVKSTLRAVRNTARRTVS